MSKIRKFMRSLARPSAGPQPTNTGNPQMTGSSQAPQKEAVKKRLATLVGPLKDALAQNGTNVAHMTALKAALEKHIRKNDLEQAAKVLDELERLVQQSKTPNLNGVMAGNPNAPTTPPPLQAGTQSAAPVSPGAGSGGAVQGGSAPSGPRKLKVRDLVEMAPPDADIANYFFARESSELTPSDKKWLDTYAEAYLAAQSPEKIHVEGWASIEGDDDFNGKLSTKRADSVRNHLIGKGVPKKRIEAIGRGPTEDFSTSDYSKNRRATLTPIPPIPPHSIEPAPAGIDIDPGPPPPPPPPPEETPAPQDVVPPAKKPKSDKGDDVETTVNEERRLYGGSSSDPKNSGYIQLKYTLTLRATDGSWVLPNMDLTLSLGKDGKLGPEVEKDLNVIQKRWENLKVAGKTFKAQVSLSLHTEVQLSDGRKVESINESVQAELEVELSKRTSLKFDVKKEVYEVYKDPSTATPPKKEPEVTVGVSRKIGGGDDKKKTPETAKEKESRRVVTDAIKRNWQEYEKARDAIVSKLPENVREKAIKQMDRAAQSEEPFVASDDLKADLEADLKAKGASSLEEEMKKAVKAYHDRILAQP